MNGNRSPIERMPAGNKSISFHDHEIYGPLIESYISSILKSGLLLDEDLEVLLSISKFKNFPEPSKYRPPLRLLASLISMVTSSYVARKYHLPLLVIPSAVITVGVFTSELKNAKRRKRNREIVNELIEVICKVHRLNIAVIRYMKTRVDLGKTKEQEFLTLYNRSVQEFVETLPRNRSVFKFLLENLNVISLYSDSLFDDFKSLEHLATTDMLEHENVTSIETCLALTQRIQDLHVLFASKLLSYIGIVLYSKSSKLREEDISSLLNDRLPQIVKYLQVHYEYVKRQFSALRRSMKKKSEYKTQTKIAGKKQISAKLQETLACSVNNLSIILEKSQNVLERIETGDENVVDAIVNLKNHTHATYESLDLLCKLYGILSNSTSNKQIETKVTNTNEIEKVLKEELPRVSYDDDTQPMEEKFELYVGKEDAVNEYPAAIYDENQSDAYLSLMLRELKQSLKQHQRFIDAKNRRGSEDDEDKIPVPKLKSPPKFNTNALRNACEHEDIRELDREKTDLPLEQPMPPPPPLPSFSLADLEEEVGRVNARSMLDNIKMLSSQRNVQEDVFGDSDTDSNCSD